MAFQELFTKSSIPVDKAKYLILPKDASKSLLTLIGKELPNIKIIYK